MPYGKKLHLEGMILVLIIYTSFFQVAVDAAAEEAEEAVVVVAEGLDLALEVQIPQRRTFVDERHRCCRKSTSAWPFSG